MNTNSKKIVSVILIAGIFLAAAALALPTSTGQAAAADITVSATPASQSGTPGSKLTFSVTVVNSHDTDISNLTFSASSALSLVTTSLSSSSASVGANSSYTVIVDATILTTASAGQNDVVTFDVYEGATFVTSASMTINIVAPGENSKRPLLGINTYSTSPKVVKGGQEFTLTFVVENRGMVSAFNNVVTFTGEGFFPRTNSGTQYIQNIEPGGKTTFTQNFLVSDSLAWSEAGTINAAVTYNDSSGKQYTDTLPITIILSPYAYSATSTPTPAAKPQLVVIGNSTDIDPLQPGSIFELTLKVRNLGSSDAKAVTMYLGGGLSFNDAGTPQAGSSSGTELTNFAPLGSSNVVVVGDIAKGSEVSIKMKLVVNVTTAPGAYTLKTSFVYTNPNNTRYVDDQVITLLVYSLPQVEVSFYQDPGVLMVGMPNMLPLQVTNLGKKTSILGNMKVTSAGGEVINNVSLVGALDPGGYYTLDSQIIPNQEGPLEIEVVINYTDDFNQAREIKHTLSLEVMPAPVMTPDPSITDLPTEPLTDTFWSKVGRFFKGLFGLDSGVKEEPQIPAGGEEIPLDGSSSSIVVPKG